MSNFIKYLFAFIFVICSGQAYAAHRLCSGFPKPLALVGTSGMISYPQNPVLPKEILNPIILNSNTLMSYCDANGTEMKAGVTAVASVQVTAADSGLKTSTGNTIFKLSGNDNFGFTIQFSDPQSASYKNKTYINNTASYTFFNQSNTVFSIGGEAIIQLVLLSMPASGVVNIPNQTIANITVVAKSGSGSTVMTTTNTSSVTLNTNNITVQAGTCAVVGSNNYTINMLPVVMGKFPSVGSEIKGGSATVTIKCDPAITPWVTMSDVTNSANTSDLLTLTATSTASGVKVRLYNGNTGTAISYGPASRNHNNTNQWQFGSIATTDSQVRSVPLNATYVRTGTMSPGDVNAQSTLTFSYQ